MDITRTEWHLMVRTSEGVKLASVHAFADSAIAAKWKKLNPHAFFVVERVFPQAQRVEHAEKPLMLDCE